MSDLLSIGSTAVAAYQRALGTVSNNIANIDTAGYTRQEISLSPAAPQSTGSTFLGTGVMFNSVTRAYNEFAESGLRGSISTLNTQGPLVQYANRVIDVMGNAQSGLAPSLDQFFAAARAVSAQPASTDLRSSLLQNADQVASRFRELAGQLGSVETETRDAIKAGVEKLNTLAKQLATVNTQLSRCATLKGQSPDILDQRDKLLRDMSALASISVTARPNGEVAVALGLSSSQSLIVDPSGAKSIGAVFSDSSTGKVDIVLDPSGSNTPIAGMSSGSLAGLIGFRQQALEPTQTKLDFLAQVFSSEINKLQGSGVDTRGEVGQPLYVIDPVFSLQSPASNSKVQVNTSVVNAAAFAFHDVELRYDGTRQRWSATDTTSKQTVTGASGASELTINGVRLNFSGTALDADMLTLKAAQRPALGIRMTQIDPQRIAAGALFRVAGKATNGSIASPSLSYKAQVGALAGPALLDKTLVNNAGRSSGVKFANASTAPTSGITTIPAGFRNVAINLETTPANSLDLQIFTRDGRQLIGPALSDTQQQALLSPANGFVAGAGYATDYLNRSGEAGYRKLDVFYGARAVAQGDPAYDAANNVVDRRQLLAKLEALAMPAATALAGSTFIAAGALSLNGKALPSLVVPAAGMQAADLANWINAAAAGVSDITASAINEIQVSATDLKLSPTRTAITINGTEITDNSGTFANAQSLMTAINAQSTATGVSAAINRDGAMTLTNTAGNAGKDIVISTPAGYVTNALNLGAATFRGHISLSSAKEMRIGIGANGSASDLAKLGLRATAYVAGAAPEDLLVFASGVGAGAVAASYEVASVDRVQQQRTQPLDISFTSADNYTITDVNTGSVLAQRKYDPQTGISYGELKLNFSTAPAAGDSFRVDGNQDGVGNNENILRIADMASNKSLLPGDKTLSEGYSDLVSAVGSIANQATISQQALSVVNKQAIEARDKASGVNLDDEAADLIRFQQAYQAAAKTIQIASQLFDSIIQIR